jgi:hypothetical protein
MTVTVITNLQVRGTYFLYIYTLYFTLLYSVALVRERTIPTERQPLAGEVSANFCG